MSSHFTMQSTIYPDCDFGPFPGQGPSFTRSWLSATTLDGVSRMTENCSVAQRTPFSSQAVVNKPQMRHTDNALKILLLCSTYSADKNSILISKAIKPTLQIIKFRPQKQQKRFASFIPAMTQWSMPLHFRAQADSQEELEGNFPNKGWCVLEFSSSKHPTETAVLKQPGKANQVSWLLK